ncbi:hypothetical protein BDV11DRAFT_214414 [Aspergillus similis]
MRAHGVWGRVLSYFLLSFLSYIAIVVAQDCSASNPCATGCCSKHGYCGVGEDFCGADCVANCDYEQVTECNENKLCPLGCCSKFGICGFGPDYCSKDNCVSTCEQKSECDPGDWSTDFANRTSCPLNVCCSAYGFCGTTEEFCGDKTVKRPSCSGKKSITRVVGYYEGWASRRPCNYYFPEQIETQPYTHLIYAFATVDPMTFEIMPATIQEGELMKRLTALKKKEQGLKVSVAIGGWTFNDPGPTVTVFSDLARSEESQQKFFKSLIPFLSTYNFDGVDIDWEYPVDADRSGRAEDFDNFPKFMANLKKALKETNGRDELSITIPTSYWYLQHFDIKSLEKHVDFFNYMSYDLHGTWDRGNKWTGSFLNGHTNLTEIRGTLDLLWRNQIPPAKVVLGLAFYSRAFTVEDTGCMEPGCTFLSASNAGPCSAEAGILLNNELDDIRSERGIQAKLDEDAAVKLLSWDDQWTAYDDEETLKLKIDFAGETCLGGIMVWAVSQDNYNHTYSKALLGAVPIRTKPHTLVEVGDSDGTITVKSHKPQCRWTGCGQTCFEGFSPVERSDRWGKKGELMLDSTQCDGHGTQTLCCPNEDIPKCGWYSWKNGNCDGTCPDGMFETGSHTKGCNKWYQSACCERGKATTELYDVLEWEPSIYCDKGSCPVPPDKKKTDVLVASNKGSGGRVCLGDFLEWDLNMPVFETTYRKLCYDPSDDLRTWDECDWYAHYDPPPEGEAEGYCTPTCPASMVRLAMEKTVECTQNGGGARVYCCKDGYYTTSTRPDPSIQRFADILDEYNVDGSCDFVPGPNVEGEEVDVSPQYRSDVIEFSIPETSRIIKEVSPDARQKKIGDIWDDWAVEHDVENLQLGVMQPNLFNNIIFIEKGAEFVSSGLWCRPQIYNETLETEETPWPCMGHPCDDNADPELCQTEEREDGESPDVMADPEQLVEGLASSLEKRISAKVFRVYCQNAPAPGIGSGWQTGLSIKPRSYYRAGLWGAHTRVFRNALSYMSSTDCGNPDLKPEFKTGHHHDTEHILELQIIAQFLQHATWGRLVDGSQANFNPIPCELFIPRTRGGAGILGNTNYMNMLDFPLFTGDIDNPEPAARLMNALGSKSNNENFYLLENVVNGMKSRIFSNNRLMDDTRRDLVIANFMQPGQILGEVKSAIAVWIYLNRPEVLDSMKVLVRNVRKVLIHLQDNYNTQNPNSPRINLQAAWDEWFNHMIKYHAERTRFWVTETILKTSTYWNTVVPPNHPFHPAVMGSLRALQGWNFWKVDWNHPPIV